MNTRRMNSATLIAAILLSLPTSNAIAQDGFDAQAFSPMPSQFENYLSVSSGGVLPQTGWEAGLFLNYADDPVVLFRDGEPLANLVDSMMTANLLGAYGIHELFEIGVDVPLVVLQSGETSTLLPEVGNSEVGFGIGDIRLVPKVRLLAPEGYEDEPEGIWLAFLLDTRLPTGDSDAFQGEGFRIAPRFALEYRLSNGYRFGANLGYDVRPEAHNPGLDVNDTFDWGLAAELPVHERLRIVPEVVGAVSVLAEELDDIEVPVEGLLGLRIPVNDELLVSAGGGIGITRGFGVPLWRVFLGITYRAEVIGDTDGDGYLDNVDGCPLDPEDFDEFEDEDGCSDPDNDQDTILDVDDSCPMDPEDFDTFQDEDGCPDPDNDGDGLLDIEDVCPLDPEDFDVFEDEDGCPDPDNDQDRILDVEDDCPVDPEVYNGFEDEDGCPDQGVVTVTCDQIEFDDTIEFETDSDVIRPVSFGLLDQIVATLVARDDIFHVSVEGHTDSRGSARYNLDLSDRRAASVMRYLDEHGIDMSRLSSAGYGEERPIDTNDSAAGRQRNRRVEFIITEQEGCSE